MREKNPRSCRLYAFLTVLCAALLAAPAAAQSYTVLHGFELPPSNPSGLFQGTDGNFYGTTANGGASGSGTVFQMTPSGTLTTLHPFTGGSDGAYPYAGLIQGTDGNFYGTTVQGGASGRGTVFQMTPSGTLTTLHPFMGGSEGANFYGTTYQGGAGGYYETVFQITPSGTLTITTMRPCAHTSTAAVNNTNNEGREG